VRLIVADHLPGLRIPAIFRLQGIGLELDDLAGYPLDVLVGPWLLPVRLVVAPDLTWMERGACQPVVVSAFVREVIGPTCHDLSDVVARQQHFPPIELLGIREKQEGEGGRVDTRSHVRDVLLDFCQNVFARAHRSSDAAEQPTPGRLIDGGGVGPIRVHTSSVGGRAGEGNPSVIAGIADRRNDSLNMLIDVAGSDVDVGECCLNHHVSPGRQPRPRRVRCHHCLARGGRRYRGSSSPKRGAAVLERP